MLVDVLLCCPNHKEMQPLHDGYTCSATLDISDQVIKRRKCISGLSIKREEWRGNLSTYLQSCWPRCSPLNFPACLSYIKWPLPITWHDAHSHPEVLAAGRDSGHQNSTEPLQSWAMLQQLRWSNQLHLGGKWGQENEGNLRYVHKMTH